MKSVTIDLARHFAGNAAGRAWLDEEGIEGMRGVFFSALAGLAGAAVMLPRGFHKRYVDLSALPTPEPYREALLADSLFMLALPAMLTAFVAVLLAPVMFPDDTDHATLTPLPLTRRQIFGAKLLALVTMLVGLIGAMTLLFSIAFPAFTHGGWAVASRAARIGAHATASAAGSLFAFLAVLAIQGVVLLLTPARFLAAISATFQCALVAALVLATPFIFHLPRIASWVSSEPSVLLGAPPAWFLGIEQVLLGNRTPYFNQLAANAGLALLIAALIAGAGYALLYRNFERLVQPVDRWRRRPAVTPRSAPVQSAPGAGAGSALQPWRGVWDFSTKTLRRNRLSQMLFLVAWASGIALAVNTLLDPLLASWARPTPAARRALLGAVATVSIPMIVMSIIGLRAAFLLPANARANWIFRLMDMPRLRRGHLAAVDRAFVRLALAPAILLAVPLQVVTLGFTTAAGAWLLSALAGLLVIELVLAGWRRVPFTCTWLPGKRPLPLLMIAVIVSLLLLWLLGELMRLALTSLRGTLTLAGVLLGIAAALRWRRLRSWAGAPLQFEDELPNRVQTLGLHQR